VAVPSSVSVVSVSTFPALIDTFPAYRDYSFFVVEDEVVFVDRDRRIVDVVPAGPRRRFSGGGSVSGGAVAAIDLPPEDIRIVQRVLIERGILRGEADGILGPDTRQAISVFQRQNGIAVTGSIDASTVSSLGVSARLSQQANQSISQSQSSTTTGAQTSTTGQGQAGTGQAQTGQSQTGQQQPSQQNATGQTPSQNTGQATNAPAQQNQPSTTTGQSTAPAQSNTTGQAAPPAQSGNQPSANQNPAPAQAPSAGSTTNQPAQSGPSR
jgi:peptidoglycan hydrolase-like protein with peptidoglycan-binding domain